MVKIALSKDEQLALEKLAWSERRRVNQQAALIIRRELERLGLLPANCTGAGDMARSQSLEVNSACLARLVHAGGRVFSLFSGTIDPALLLLTAISQTIMSDYLLPALLLVCIAGWSLLLLLIQQAVEQAVKEAAH